MVTFWPKIGHFWAVEIILWAKKCSKTDRVSIGVFLGPIETLSVLEGFWSKFLGLKCSKTDRVSIGVFFIPIETLSVLEGFPCNNCGQFRPGRSITWSFCAILVLKWAENDQGIKVLV